MVSEGILMLRSTSCFKQPEIHGSVMRRVSEFLRRVLPFALMTLIIGVEVNNASAQGCDNADFGTLDFSNWVGRTMTWQNMNPVVGIVNGRHTIMVGNGTDNLACDDITVVAPGYEQSARLGRPAGGYEVEDLRYTYTVADETALFTYRYAVVLNDPGHTPAQQPRFEIRVMNANGQLISPQCGFYQVVAAANITGFRSCGNNVKYRAWTPVGIDLSAYVGQQVTIEFLTANCTLGAAGHYGYAYIVAECNPLEIQVDYCPSNSDQAILTAPSGFDYQWSTGQTTQQIIISDPPDGAIYSCQLTAVTGCQVTVNATITSTAVVADFSYPAPCPGVPLQFTDQSINNIGSIISWEWDFGDGNTSTEQNPEHTFALSGLYNVTLRATTDAGCLDTYSETVNVNPFPQAGYTVPPVCDGTTSQFINTTLFPPTIGSWEWEFGDGSPVNTTEWNTSHTYSVPGDYETRFIARSQSGACTDTAYFTASVAPLPIASFDMDDVCFGSTVVLTNTSQGQTTNTRWEFGDNSPPSFFNNTTHDYIAPGTYNVSLLITNQQGCQGQTSQNVTVSPSPISDFSFTNVCQGQPMPFVNSSTIPPDGNVIGSWTWNFGDGSPANSNDWNPNYTYQQSGVFYVSLVTRSLDGVCSDTLIDSVRVHALPVVEFDLENVCDGLPVQFIQQSTGEISSWRWDFGDNSPPNFNANISYTYPAPGSYSAQLTVTTIYDCADTRTKPVTVHPSPDVSFNATDVCFGTTTFMNTTSTVPAPSTIVSHSWNVADGSPVMPGTQISHDYAFSGNFNVKHVVVTDRGCRDSTTQIVTVHPNPIVEFDAEPRQGCSPLCVTFYEQSAVSSGFNQSFAWDFGDGSGSNQQATAHCYQNTTTNTTYRWPVTLSVTSNEGCNTTLTKGNFVTNHPVPRALFDMNPTITTIIRPRIKFSDRSVDAVQWLWDFGDEQIFNTSNLPSPEYTYLDTGEYVITQIVVNEFGCRDTMEAKLYVAPDFTVYIPDAFTPDDNGVNDRFWVRGTGITSFQMQIFDRWGKELHFSEDMDEGWAGDVNRNGSAVQNGTYVYRVMVTDLMGEEYWYHGRVTLFK